MVGRLRGSISGSSKAVVDEDWSMVVFMMVPVPLIKVSIKESIKRIVFLLHNFVPFKIKAIVLNIVLSLCLIWEYFLGQSRKIYDEL